jgi:L-lactate dehydrogenase (cytochrome)
MPVITNINDLKALHRRRTPRMFWDYCESGSWTEQTFRENVTDYDKLRFRQRVAVDISNRTLKTTMLGEPVSMPVALAPIGSLGMQHADGEILAARAAARFGVPFTLSTMSVCSIEDVAQFVPEKPFWFQLYVMQDEVFVDEMIERARAAKCSALVLTLDLQLLGQRHKDLKNGLSTPPKLTVRNMIDFATRVRWSMGMARTPRRTFRNIVGHAKDVGNIASLSSWANEQFDPKLDWPKVERIRDRWGGKFIIKGILDPEDARKCVEVGADAIVVSNHGGRQLDGALSSIRMLPSILREVEGETEVLIDGGIRSGQDVLKIRALGAQGALIGRPYVYGLGAMGEAGVTKALEIIRKELDLTMALTGRRDIETVNRDILLVPKDFEGDWAENM